MKINCAINNQTEGYLIDDSIFLFTKKNSKSKVIFPYSGKIKSRYHDSKWFLGLVKNLVEWIYNIDINMILIDWSFTLIHFL